MENEYVDPKLLIIKLQDRLNLSLNEIKQNVASSGVILSENDIKDYLAKTFKTEKQDIYNKLCAENDEKNYMEKYLIEKQYAYEPYTLKYYKKIVSIYKGKCLKLLSIIEHIYNKNISEIFDLLLRLDISIDSNNEILYDDVIRLIDPFVYNYNMLNEKLRKANDLDTYLNNKISLDDVYRVGASEEDLYPSEKLQGNLYYDYSEGYIPLTQKQIDNFNKEFDKYVNELFDILIKDQKSKVLKK